MSPLTLNAACHLPDRQAHTHTHIHSPLGPGGLGAQDVTGLIPFLAPQEVTRAHELEVRLHTFSMFGMPRLPPEDRRRWEIGEGGDTGLTIEKSWKELVPGHKVGL